MKRERNNRGGEVEGGESKRAAAEKVVKEEVAGEEGWCWLRGREVDEQMSWGYMTMPKWGVEFVDECYGDVFGDVVWDFDIWNLKTVNIPDVPPNP